MKLTLFLLFFLSYQCVSFSAEHHSLVVDFQDSLETILQKKILPNGEIFYEFRSNKLLLSHRIDVWESRFLNTFLEIISIKLNDFDQSICLVLSTDHSPEYLNSILRRFEVTNFLIQTE